MVVYGADHDVVHPSVLNLSDVEEESIIQQLMWDLAPHVNATIDVRELKERGKTRPRLESVHHMTAIKLMSALPSLQLTADEEKYVKSVLPPVVPPTVPPLPTGPVMYQ